MKKIGYVEDNDSIRENYAECLIEAGFSVDAYTNAEDALKAFRNTMPDLLLLDVGLGHQRDGGLQLCFEIRKFNDTVPIIFLTSHDKDYEKISGLRMGADDYLIKDSHIDYIVVRIETLLRRVAALQSHNSVTEQNQRITELQLNDTTCQAYFRNKNLDLSLTQFWILKALYEAQGKLKSHSELMKAANIVVEPNTIVAHVKAIRNHFKSVDKDFDSIRTVRGVGYQWLSPEG
ncbi:MAG: response regulator transcription factor [Aestuariibacter sp.]